MLNRFPFGFLFPRLWVSFEHTAWDLPGESVAAFFKMLCLIGAALLVLGLMFSNNGSGNSESTAVQSQATTTSANHSLENFLPVGATIKADGKVYSLQCLDGWSMETFATISVSGIGASSHQGTVVGKNGWVVVSKVSGYTDTYTLKKGSLVIHIWDKYSDADNDVITYG